MGSGALMGCRGSRLRRWLGPGRQECDVSACARQAPSARRSDGYCSYINGLGGDPGFDYEYRVQGHLFTGSGVGEPTRGETVAVEYAADAPSESCFCAAARDAPESLESAFFLACVLTLPLVFLLFRAMPRVERTRRSWFVRVHGFGEWAGFLMGILVAVAFGAYLLADFLAVALER
jgi:hypothetical protein